MSSNIKVAIRVRPLILREKTEKLKEQWEIKENSMYPIDVTSGKRNGDIYFFDHIFDSTYFNVDIYNTVVHPVVDKAMNGFNGTIFAYGQTSSGKTYTMMGNAKEDGLISIAVQNIFQAIEQSVNRKFLLRVSYMEIYNEKIYDLLDIKNAVKISEDLSGVIVNVKEELTDSAEKVYDIMKKGDKARRIGETNMNEKSSRSHTIFRIIIESSDISDTGVVNVAHLNLVDLAGSERATFTKATGLRLKEGSHINKSLSALSLVMKQLSEAQDYINFRDSKLTRILQPSLGGNALTAIICAVTPAALEETHSTLAFASRAKTVKNKPMLNEIMTDEALINKYAMEIHKLKQDLERANDNRNLQAQKIALLEQSFLFPKKTNSSNKNRRKTWSAPIDPNGSLPIIYETDVLKLSDNLEPEVPAFEDYSTDTVKSTPCSKKEPIAIESSPRSDIVNWLTNSTETPKSVLRERADYYEKEFEILKELTTKEKLLLMNDHNSEMESLKAELSRVTNELECERKGREEDKVKFDDEMEVLQSTLDEVKRTNDELRRSVEKKNDDHKNECELLYNMYKEKYEAREKELIDSLTEARELIKLNNTVIENKPITPADEIISINLQILLEEYKTQLIRLKSELESEEPLSVIQNMFSEVNRINEKIITNCPEYSEDFYDLLNVFNCIFDLASVMLSDNTDLEKDKYQLQKREKTYELLVTKQDEEIKHLSDNILQYMNELAFQRNEVEKYKEIVNTAHPSYENDSINQSETVLTSDQCLQTDEDISELIRSKDIEIENLLVKIEEYQNQLAVNEDLMFKYKSQLEVHEEQIDAKEKKIEEMTANLKEERNKFNSVEYLVSKYKSQLERETEKNEAKDIEIEELSENVMNYISEIAVLQDEMTSIEGQLDTCKKEIKSKEKLMDQICDIIKQLSTQENSFGKIVYEIKKGLLALFSVQGLNESHFCPEIELQIGSQSSVINELSESQYSVVGDNIKLKDEQEKLKEVPIAELGTKEIEFNVEDQNDEFDVKIQIIREIIVKNYHNANRLTAIKETIKKFKECFNYHCDMLDYKTEEYKNKLCTINKELQNKNLDIRVLQHQNLINISKKWTLESQLRECQQELEQLKKSCHEGREKNYITSKEVQELTCKQNNYEGKLESYKIHIEELKLKITDYVDLLCKTKKELDNYKLISETEKEKHEYLSCHIVDLTTELNEFKSQGTRQQEQENKIAHYQSVIDSKNKELEAISYSNNENLNKIATLTKELEKYKNREEMKDYEELLESKDKEIDEISLKNIQYLNKLHENREEIEKLTKNYKQKVKQCDALSANIENGEEMLYCKNEEVKELRHENIDYKNKLFTMTEELERYKLQVEDKTLIEVNAQLSEEIILLKAQIAMYGNLEEQVALKDRAIQKLSLEKNSLEKVLQLEPEKTVTMDDLKQENEKLEKKNMDYKKIVEQVTQKANKKIEFYNKIVQKQKNDIELLRAKLKAEQASNQELQKKMIMEQVEQEKRNTEKTASDNVKLQSKLNNLDEANKKLSSVIENYQEQIYVKDKELSNMKKAVQSLKYENTDLHRITKELNFKLSETEAIVKSAQLNLQLLEKEKENYSKNTRILEESLEEVKSELYDQKIKEKNKILKVKRQSWHDSFRNLSDDEPIDTSSDKNEKNEYKEADKSNECESCKMRLNLLDRENSDRNEISKHQLEVQKLQKKCNQLTHLCKFRKAKIDELEREVSTLKML